jgi:hypothetical protein
MHRENVQAHTMCTVPWSSACVLCATHDAYSVYMHGPWSKVRLIGGITQVIRFTLLL